MLTIALAAVPAILTVLIGILLNNARLSDEMRIQSARDQRFDVGKMWDHDEDAGIRGFIKTLFD